jgi:hypothetical protein
MNRAEKQACYGEIKKKIKRKKTAPEKSNQFHPFFFKLPVYFKVEFFLQSVNFSST